MIRMPGIKMLEGTMTAIEANYLITQGGKTSNTLVRIVPNPYEPGFMEIHIRDSVIHNFDKARRYLHLISDTEHGDMPHETEKDVNILKIRKELQS